ncbi:MAG TPA: DUF86 domain-containing protein [Pyrinomonadaceae bacterium]|nr:DUF86 domain-containing protein [Pyrinomonadaceae bacterium]
MNNKDNTVYLKHILECVERVDEYLAGLDYEQFIQSQLLIDAVTRNIEIVGEACNNLTRDFRSNNPQIEWRRIIGTRNVLIHAYAAVDLEIIWNITQLELPKLRMEIGQILEG